ncbi:protein FAR1-RELATED SEQUENCE 5-like [Phragmites australis]|uniref:protein FAR1-RELATED SEQUENCE 5-like n=1 Tax=Phragmites australis TaxID=29695 RepID=UPI002D776B2F|nr:protein FAR1-RELATED SEQUENCE 5-like [Phragmites australis]
MSWASPLTILIRRIVETMEVALSMFQQSVDGSLEADGSGENESGAGAAQDAEKSQKDPTVGMTFPTEDEAFNFYNACARWKGFSVRKGHLSRRKCGTVCDRHFVCSFEGKPPPHHTHMIRKHRSVQKSNCLARLELMENPADKRWIIKRFNDEHNHPLASPNKTFMLRSNRKKSAPDVLTESDFYYGVKPAPVQQLWSEEPARVRDAPVVAKDQVSCLSTLRSKEFDKGNTQILLDALTVKQSEDPSFVYAIQLDEKERLTNCFCTDARSVVDYSYFGYAVTLETTYRSSGFDLLFVAFLGVNHHKQVIIFGAALLLDESVESFTWLLRTFLAAMSGRQPKTIFRSLCCNIQSSFYSNAWLMPPAMSVAYTYYCIQTCPGSCSGAEFP